MSIFDEIEDITIFTEGEFSDRALVSRGDRPIAPTEISGIFDSNYDAVFDTYSVAEGKRITFMVETQNAEGIRSGDRLFIKGRNYLIAGIEAIEDGKLTNLILKET